MSQWGDRFTICGVTVLPHVNTKGFEPVSGNLLIDDFTVIGIDASADVERARATLEPFRGKPVIDLVVFLNDLCVNPISKKVTCEYCGGSGWCGHGMGGDTCGRCGGKGFVS